MAGGGFITGTGVWETGGNWSEGAVPAVDERAVVSRACANNITNPTGSASLIDLNLLMVDRGFTGLFGTAAAPIKGSADLVQFMGGRGIYWSCDLGAGGLKCDRMEIMVADNSVPVVLSSTGASLGTYLDIVAMRGNITLDAGLTFEATSVLEVGKVSSDSDVNLTLGSGVTVLPALEQASGLVTSSRAITAATVGPSARLVQDTALLTTLKLWGRCDMNWGDGTFPGAPAITTAYCYPGSVLDLTQTSLYKTITTLYVYPGARIIYNNLLHVITTLHDYSGGTAMVAA